jgi:hypothetical protein
MTNSCSCENQRSVLNPILTCNYVNWFSLWKLGRERGDDSRTAQHEYRYPKSLIHPIITRNLVQNPFLREGGGSGPVYILLRHYLICMKSVAVLKKGSTQLKLKDPTIQPNSPPGNRIILPPLRRIDCALEWGCSLALKHFCLWNIFRLGFSGDMNHDPIQKIIVDNWRVMTHDSQSSLKRPNRMNSWTHPLQKTPIQITMQWPPPTPVWRTNWRVNISFHDNHQYEVRTLRIILSIPYLSMIAQLLWLV